MKYVIIFFVLCTAVIAAENEFTSQTIDIGIICTDLEKSIEFYTTVIGMEEKSTFDVNADVAKRTGLSNGIPFHVKVLKLGNQPTATQWKLMQFGDRSEQQKNQYIYNHSGMQYITINVTDLTPFLQRIKKSDIELLGDTPTKLAKDRYFVLVQDPDGTFIELIGPYTEAEK